MYSMEINNLSNVKNKRTSTEDLFNQYNESAINDSYSINNAKDYFDKYSKYDVYPGRSYTEEEVNREQAKNQSALEQVKNSLAQIIENEIGLGIPLGISNLIDLITVALDKDKELFEYENPVTTALRELQDKNKERLAIYQVEPNKSWAVNDFGWWANNFVSVGSTVSLMLPSMGITALSSKIIGGVFKANRLTYKATRGFAKAVNSANKSKILVKYPNIAAKKINSSVEIANTALLSRTMENIQEGQEVYKETYEDAKNRLSTLTDEQRQNLIKNNSDFANKTDDEIAKYIAGDSAKKTFVNDYWMLLMDIAQFKAISKISKGLKNPTSNFKVWKAKRDLIDNFGKNLEKEVGKDINTFTKTGNWFKDRNRFIKENLFHVLQRTELSEAIEEGFQGIQTEKGREVLEKYFNPNYTERDLNSYLTDGRIWEQAFWGTIGGLTFGSTGRLLNYGRRRYLAHDYKEEANKKGNFDEKIYNNIKIGETSMQLANIEAIKTNFNTFVSNMESINKGINPYNFELDDTGDIKKLEEGQTAKKEISKDEEDLYRDYTIDNYIADMVIQSSQAGNSELLYELVKSEAFNNAVNNIDGLNSKSNQYEQTLAEKIKSYSDIAVGDIVDVSEIFNDKISRGEAYGGEWVVNGLAAQITRNKIRKARLQESYDKLGLLIDNIDVIDKPLKENFKSVVTNIALKQVLDDIENDKSSLYNQWQQRKITKYGYDAQIKELNRVKEKIINNFVNYATIGFTESFNDLFDSIKIPGKEKNNYKLKNLKEFETKFNEWYNEFIQPYIGKKESDFNVTKDFKDKITRQLNIAIEYEYYDSRIPKTKEDFEEFYDTLASSMELYAMNRANDALTELKEYLEKSENPEELLDKMLLDNWNNSNLDEKTIKKIQEDIKVAKLVKADILNAIVKEILAKKQHEEERQNTTYVNGEIVEEDEESIIMDEDEETNDNTEQPKLNVVENEENPENAFAEEVYSEDIDKHVKEDIKFIDSAYEQTSTEFNKHKSEDKIEQTLDIYVKSRLSKKINDSKRGNIYFYELLLNEEKTAINNSSSLYQNLIKQLVEEIKKLNYVGVINNEGELEKLYGDEITDDDIKYLADLCVRKILTFQIAKNNKKQLKNNRNSYAGTMDLSTIADLVLEIKNGQNLIKAYNEFVEKYKKANGYHNKKPVSADKLFLYLIDNEVPKEIIRELVKTVNLYNGSKQYNDKIDIKFDGFDYNKEHSVDKYIDYLYGLYNAVKQSNSSITVHNIGTRTKAKKDNDTLTEEEANKKKELLEKAFKELEKGKGKTYYKDSGTENYINLMYKFEDGTEIELAVFTKIKNINDNTEFEINVKFTHGPNGTYINNRGFLYKIKQDFNKNIISNTDTFFNTLINIWQAVDDLVEKDVPDSLENIQNELKSKNINVTLEDIQLFKYILDYGNDAVYNRFEFINEKKQIIEDIFKSELFKSVVFGTKSGAINIDNILMGFGGQINLTNLTDENKQEIVQEFIKNIAKILLFGNDFTNRAFENENVKEAKTYYNNWKNILFTNYNQCATIQDALIKSKDNTLDVSIINPAPSITHGNNVSNGILKYNFTKIGEKVLNNNPIAVIKDSVLMIEGKTETYQRYDNSGNGSMGIVVGYDNGRPIVSWFNMTGTQKLVDANTEDSKKLLEAVKQELHYLLQQFIDKDYDKGKLSFEEFGIALESLVYRKGLFTGFTINRKGDTILINYTNRKNKDGKLLADIKIDATNENSIVHHISYQQPIRYTTYNKETIDGFVDILVNHLEYNKSFFMFEEPKKTDYENEIPYFKRKNGKFIIEFNRFNRKEPNFVQEYDSYTHFALAHNAFKLNLNQVNGEYSFYNVDNYGRSIPIESYYLFNTNGTIRTIEQPVKKEDIKDIDSYDNNEQIDIDSALKSAGYTQQQIDAAHGKVENEKGIGIDLLDVEVYRAPKEKDNQDVNAYYTKSGNEDKIYLTKKGIESSKGKDNSLMRILIHENIHSKINKLNTMDKKNIVDDTIKLYNNFIEHLKRNDNISAIEVLKKNSLTLDTFAKANNLVGKSQEEINKRFAEEWIVESLTQESIIDLLRKYTYDGEKLTSKYNSKKKETIWDKIVRIIFDIFGITPLDISEQSSIFAKQLEILDATTKETKNKQSNKQQVRKHKLSNPAEISEGTSTKTNKQEVETKDESTDNNYEELENISEDEITQSLMEDIINSENNVEEVQEEIVEEFDEDDILFSVADDITIDEINIKAVDTGTDFSIDGVQAVTTINDYINTFQDSLKPLIAENIKNGDIKYLCG